MIFAVPQAFEALASDESQLCRSQDQSDDSSWASDKYNGGHPDPTSSSELGDGGPVKTWINYDKPIINASGITIGPLFDEMTGCLKSPSRGKLASAICSAWARPIRRFFHVLIKWPTC